MSRPGRKYHQARFHSGRQARQLQWRQGSCHHSGAPFMEISSKTGDGQVAARADE
jgi:hypothetical protein